MASHIPYVSTQPYLHAYGFSPGVSYSWLHYELPPCLILSSTPLPFYTFVDALQFHIYQDRGVPLALTFPFIHDRSFPLHFTFPQIPSSTNPYQQSFLKPPCQGPRYPDSIVLNLGIKQTNQQPASTMAKLTSQRKDAVVAEIVPARRRAFAQNQFYNQRGFSVSTYPPLGSFYTCHSTERSLGESMHTSPGILSHSPTVLRRHPRSPLTFPHSPFPHPPFLQTPLFTTPTPTPQSTAPRKPIFLIIIITTGKQAFRRFCRIKVAISSRANRGRKKSIGKKAVGERGGGR